MKKYKYFILIVVIIVGAIIGFLVLRQNHQIPPSATISDYNPNYADAIQQKKPELCRNIKYALQSGPTDAIDKIYGDEAIERCESQAKVGFFGCECDSDKLLNNMRKP